MSPLSHLRVIERASTIPARVCGRQFARWGADVVSFVQPAGTGSTEADLLDQSLNAGKRLASGAPGDDLLRSADVLIVDQSPEPDAGLPPIVIDVSPFGRTGDYAGYLGNTFIVEAMSGFMSVQGEKAKAPLRMPAAILARACGVAAFNAGLAAIVKGTPDHIEVSCMEVLATIVPTLRTQLDQVEQRDGGPGIRPLGVRLYQFGDSWLSFNFALPPALPALLDIIGLDETHIPPELQDLRDRQDFPRLKTFVEQLDSPFDAHDLFTIISAPPHSSAVGKVLQPAETITDPQLAGLGYWQEVAGLKRTGPPARLPRSPAAATCAEAPFDGWQGEGFSLTGSANAQAPLAGVRIVDLTQAWIGPYASQILGDLGADIIKVESLTKPDVWRKLPPKKPPHLMNAEAKLVNTSPNFNSVNRDKRSLTLDLASTEGREQFLALVKHADVVMENYRPGVMPRLNLDYDVLSSVKPDLVVSSFSAYGETGPYADYRGNGTTIEALSGWDSAFGYADGPPLVMGFYQADAITGLQMAASTLAALIHRQRTGEGQHLRGSMLETAVDYIEELVMLQQLTGEVPRLGNCSPTSAPQGVYRAAGEDCWLAVSVDSQAAWQALCKLLPDLDPGWALADRHTHHDRIDAALERWCRDKDAPQAAAMLQAKGIPAAPVQTTAQLLADRHLASRAWWHTLSHPDLGTQRYAGFPWRFRDARLACRHPSPRLGQHSRQVLSEELGLTDEAIDQLFASGISGEDW